MKAIATATSSRPTNGRMSHMPWVAKATPKKNDRPTMDAKTVASWAGLAEQLRLTVQQIGGAGISVTALWSSGTAMPPTRRCAVHGPCGLPRAQNRRIIGGGKKRHQQTRGYATVSKPAARRTPAFSAQQRNACSTPPANDQER